MINCHLWKEFCEKLILKMQKQWFFKLLKLRSIFHQEFKNMHMLLKIHYLKISHMVILQEKRELLLFQD